MASTCFVLEHGQPCGRSVVGWNLCGKHYQRWKIHGDPTVKKSKWKLSEEQRFWQYVNKTDNCWIWTGGKSHGYGNFYVSRNGQESTVQAHVYAYELLVEPVPDGKVLDHLCHTDTAVDCTDGDGCPHRACVRWDHLEPVTGPDNTRRGGNAVKTHCKRGHPLEGDNLYTQPAGGRVCITCRRESEARYRERNRAVRPT